MATSQAFAVESIESASHCDVNRLAEDRRDASAFAQRPADPDGVDRLAPGFVRASLLVAGPGDELFSCAGHACLRLECPTYNLDYCFSYESERISDRVAAFFLGRLTMGLFAVPTAEFLKEYREGGRGVVQYPLELPPDAKQRLWRIMDDLAAKGAELPYDYMKRGCSLSVMECLREALAGHRLAVDPWPKRLSGTWREITCARVAPRAPWKILALQLIVGTAADRELPEMRKVIMPDDLVDVLRAAKVDGAPVLAAEGAELLPQTLDVGPPPVRPTAVALLLLAVAIANIWAKSRVADWAFLVLQSAVGAFLAFLVFFSSLPATDWNWNIVPFNPLPLVLWRWRRFWSVPFAAVVAVWEASMLLSPHALTDPAFLVFAAAFCIVVCRDVILRLYQRVMARMCVFRL